MDKHKSKLDIKELKRLKKEKKKLKEKELLERLDKTKSLQASLAAKPVPKVNHSFSSLPCFFSSLNEYLQNIVSGESQAAAGRGYTVGVAVAGSILDNAQTPELRTYLAGQVARAAAIFNVDEVVVFNDKKVATAEAEGGAVGRGCVQMARILQYLECPQYLRRNFFPIHSDLKHAGLLSPTDMPHHVRAEEESLYREGVVVEREAGAGRCWVNIGLKNDCLVERSLRAGLRVTVRLGRGYTWDKVARGEVVSPSEPRTRAGQYWGYTTRVADTLSQVFTGCPHKEGYDLMLGTSERGEDVEAVSLRPFKHLLVVLGGVGGLEAALEADQGLDISDPKELFDHYVNVCPNQGSRTIRTEEALLITMSALRSKICAANL